jgi:hypothetical protein
MNGTPFEVGKTYYIQSMGLKAKCLFAFEGLNYYNFVGEVLESKSMNCVVGEKQMFSGPSWKEYKEPRTLSGWVSVYPNSYDKGWHVFWGHIHEDTRQRFYDGAWIHTSHCVEPDAKEGDVVHTLNSTYLLGKPAQ